MATMDRSDEGLVNIDDLTTSAYRPVTFKDIRYSNRIAAVGLLVIWALSTIVCVILGLMAISGSWSGLPLGLGGVDIFISLYPPLTICMLWTLWFGFWWGAIPAYLATFVLALDSGLQLGWALLFAFSNPLGLAVFTLSYKAIALPYAARTPNAVVFFFLLAFISSVFGASGSFVWTLNNDMGIRDVYAIWQGWWFGNTLQKSLLVLPLLVLFTPWVTRWRDHVFNKRAHESVSRKRVLATVGVLGAGVFLFLGLSFYLSKLTAADIIATDPDMWQAANDVVAQSAQAVYWIMGVVVLSISYLGYRFFSNWTEALETSAQAAMKANQAKSDFLARMSHELRTPINGVIGMAQLMERTELTNKQRSYLEKAISSANLLTGVIDDILDFSKIEAGRLELEYTRFDLDDVLSNLSHVIALKAEQKGIELLFHVGDRVPRILRGDPLRLGQVLINLANNAIKFTEYGEVIIDVSLVRDERNVVVLKFAVQDTGIGLSERQVQNLFRPFTQADESVTRKYGGTGLGLAICKQLVELMNGTVEVSSQKGHGSCFAFTVPFEVVRQRQPELVKNALGGKRALVVDDNQSARNIIASMLSHFGFSVDKAASGQEALLALKSATGQPYQLVVLDWKLPGSIDGIEIAEYIKAQAGPPWPPKVLLVTGNARDMSHFTINRNVDGYLVKPVCESLLLDTVMDLFMPAAPEMREEVEATGLPPESLKGATILLVEDNAINREIVREFLEDAEAVVVEAESGQEAVSAVQRRHFDAILMDLQMPNIDGIKTTKMIKQRSYAENTPVIALTAHALSSVKEECRQAGMVDHLVKPIDANVLYDTLAYWMEREDGVDLAASAKHPSIRLAKEIQDTSALLSVDVSAGLRRLGHKKERYISIAKDFLEMYSDAGDELRKALTDGDHQLIFERAHAMGPLARYLGADHLSETLAALETAARGKGGNLDDLVFDSISALNTMRISLASVIRDDSDEMQLSREELDVAGPLHT